MKLFLFILCIVFLSQFSSEETFQGELIYYHNMQINSEKYDVSSKKYFDTLKIIYKDKNYVKTTNKTDFEKEIFIDSLKKIYLIYRDNLSKSKKLSMNLDNLNYGKLSQRENSHFGSIISFVITDTIFQFKNEDSAFKKLEVKRKYGVETYVFSESDRAKLKDHRNILRNMGEQIHPSEITAIIDNSLLYYYKLTAHNTEGFIEYTLVDINHKPISDSSFKIPEHKDAKGYKKENKKSGRFKFYELIE